MPFNRDSLLLYAITDRAWTGRQTLLEQIEGALRGGGMAGIAVVSAIFAAGDIQAAAEQLKMEALRVTRS